MANYATSNYLGTAPVPLVVNAVSTILALTAATATLTQGCLIDVSFGQAPTAGYSSTDSEVTWFLSSVTTAGTAAASPPTPRPTQPGWRASGTVAGVNHTANPTGVATLANQLYAIAINQRASYRWMPVPGSELYWPATNASGVAVSALSNTTGGYTGVTITSVTHTE